MNIIEILLQDAYQSLPPAIREWYENYDVPRHGLVNINGDTNFSTRLLRRILGFPPPQSNVKLKAVLQNMGDHDRWLRYFDGGSLHSNVRLDQEHQLIYENFVGFKVYFKLVQQDQSLIWQFHHATFMGIKCPPSLSPKFHAYEYSNNAGKYAFYVDVEIPFFGKIVHFDGALF